MRLGLVKDGEARYKVYLTLSVHCFASEGEALYLSYALTASARVEC